MPLQQNLSRGFTALHLSLSLCPTALVLLESVGFLWCWACVKIWLFLAAGHISRVWKSRRAQFMPLAGQGVSESCNFFLAVWDWGRTRLLSREAAWFIHCPVYHSLEWDHLLKVRGDAGLVPVVPTIYSRPWVFSMYHAPISSGCPVLL